MYHPHQSCRLHHYPNRHNIADWYPSRCHPLDDSCSVSPGNLDHFEFSTVAGQVAGDAFSATITACDVAGNPVAGYNGHGRLEVTIGCKTRTT